MKLIFDCQRVCIHSYNPTGRMARKKQRSKRCGTKHLSTKALSKGMQTEADEDNSKRDYDSVYEVMENTLIDLGLIENDDDESGEDSLCLSSDSGCDFANDLIEHILQHFGDWEEMNEDDEASNDEESSNETSAPSDDDVNDSQECLKKQRIDFDKMKKTLTKSKPNFDREDRQWETLRSDILSIMNGENEDFEPPETWKLAHENFTNALMRELRNL